VSEDRQQQPAAEGMGNAVGRKAERKLRARAERRHGLWFGIGMFGLVGWAVAVPTLTGVGLGIWLDSRFPLGFSWTLTGLGAGVLVGCLNAWWWINREGRADSGADREAK